MSFIPPIGAATSSTRGLVKLAGDLAGAADAPTVPGLSAKLDSSEKGAVNGVASLDSGGKLTSAQVTFPVTSVASKTGDVTLTKSDVGLTNVDNHLMQTSQFRRQLKLPLTLKQVQYILMQLRMLQTYSPHLMQRQMRLL